jgi:hypothetical protein
MFLGFIRYFTIGFKSHHRCGFRQNRKMVEKENQIKIAFFPTSFMKWFFYFLYAIFYAYR